MQRCARWIQEHIADLDRRWRKRHRPVLDESSLQFSRQLVANLERPDFQDVAGVLESGKPRAKHDSNFARPRLAFEMDRFAPGRDRRIPVVLCEKISPAVRHRESQTDRCAFSGGGSARSRGLVAARISSEFFWFVAVAGLILHARPVRPPECAWFSLDTASASCAKPEPEQRERIATFPH